MNQQNNKPDDELLPEYDFSQATRGKHHADFNAGTNIVLLDPDVAEFFHDSAAVNEALRVLVRIAREQSNISKSA